MQVILNLKDLINEIEDMQGNLMDDLVNMSQFIPDNRKSKEYKQIAKEIRPKAKALQSLRIAKAELLKVENFLS